MKAERLKMKQPTRASSTAQAHQDVAGNAVVLPDQAEDPLTVGTQSCTPLPVKDAAHAARLAEKIDRLQGDIELSPAYNASTAINAFRTDKDRDTATNLLSVADKVARMAESIRAGDMADIEALLLAQASALNVIFTTYCLRSAEAEAHARDREKADAHARTNPKIRPEARADQLLLLALKAQACSRATLATLIDLKFPRTTVIARQANLANGHQQVNNGAAKAPDNEHGAVLESGGQVAKHGASNSSVGQFPRARARRGTPR